MAVKYFAQTANGSAQYTYENIYIIFLEICSYCHTYNAPGLFTVFQVQPPPMSNMYVPCLQRVKSVSSTTSGDTSTILSSAADLFTRRLYNHVKLFPLVQNQITSSSINIARSDT